MLQPFQAGHIAIMENGITDHSHGSTSPYRWLLAGRLHWYCRNQHV